MPPPYKEENHSSSKPFTENQEDALECRFDDDENHSLRHAHGGPQHASPEAELREIFRSKTGDEISRDVEQRIWEAVEVRGVTRIEFIEELRPHVQNAWHNPAGFLTDFAKNIRRKKAGSSQATVTVKISRQIPETERCPNCRAGYTRYDKDPAAREYCTCSLGQELKRMDARIAAQAASQKTVTETVRATGTEAVETTL